MKIYLLIDHADYYEAVVVAAFTSESRALEYGEAYAKQEHLSEQDWWVDDYELDPTWEPVVEDKVEEEISPEDAHVAAVLDLMLPDVYNAVVSNRPIHELLTGGRD